MTNHPALRTLPSAPRGFSRADALVTLAASAIMIAVVIPVAMAARSGARGSVSATNLIQLGEAHDCYAADWSGRQFVAVPDDLGAAGGACMAYVSEIGCIPPLLLGFDGGASPSIWGFFVWSGARCESGPFTLPGGACNLTNLRPLSFASPAAAGVHRLGNTRPIQNYAGGRFYDPVFFAPDDEPSYKAASQFFESEEQFAGPVDGGLPPTSYTLSPAALYHPDVFRRPSQGGFQDPDQLAHSYQAPRVAQATYPSLKSRLIEHFWTGNAPAPCNPAYEDAWVGTFSPGCSPYTFSQGAEAVPLTLFFDGSVRRVPTAQAIANDASMRLHTGGDGLWSRDTPYGNDGYLGQFSFDGTTTGHHALTTDGLLGRDILK